MWKSISQSYRFATMFQPPCFETERIRVSDLSERHLSPGFGFGAPRDPPIDGACVRQVVLSEATTEGSFLVLDHEQMTHDRGLTRVDEQRLRQEQPRPPRMTASGRCRSGS